MHAASIGAARARDIEFITRAVMAEEGTVVALTLTAQHRAGQALAATFSAVVAAWGVMTAHRRWRRHEVIGWVRATEVTAPMVWLYPDRTGHNGWHPHLHVLLFLPGKLTTEQVLRLRDDVFVAYNAGLRKHGYTCDREHGVRLDVATDRREAESVLAKYLTKIASEVTRHDQKRGHAGRMSPFELLVEATQYGNADALDLWREYEEATFGRRALEWSRAKKDQPSIRDRYGLGREQTDQEIADAETLGDDAALVIPTAEWPRVAPWRTLLLDTCERGGSGAAADLLTSRGVSWEVPPDARLVWTDDARRALERANMPIRARIEVGLPRPPGGPDA